MSKRRSEGLLLECTRCLRMLPRGHFRRRAGAKPGWRHAGSYRSHCRECAKPVRAAAAARRRGRVVGSYTGADVMELYSRQRGLCVLCGRRLDVVGYHVDHVKALARGGLNVAGNLQLLCPRCNLRKGAR